MSKRTIRKGDQVIVLTGRDRGRKGEVLRVIPREERVVVRGVGMVWHHKAASQAGPGGREQRESPIHISNVSLIDPESGTATRVRRARESDGNLRRIAVRSGKQIEG